MTNMNTAARDAVEGRRSMTGFLASLSPAQQAAALAYQGPENHGDPAFAREDQRRLHINDSFAVRRFGDRIVATVGAFNVELSLEEARRTADALSLFAATADAEDIEVEEVGSAA